MMISRQSTHDVNISTVKSVSGFAVEVLKLEPFLTVNHWPFLVRSLAHIYYWNCAEGFLPLNNQFAFSKIGQDLLPRFKCPGR